MTEIDVPDWVVEVAKRAWWAHEGVDYDDTMRAALTAALGAMGIAELIETARTLSGSISFRIDDPRCELHCKLADALLRFRTKENADVS